MESFLDIYFLPMLLIQHLNGKLEIPSYFINVPLSKSITVTRAVFNHLPYCNLTFCFFLSLSLSLSFSLSLSLSLPLSLSLFILSIKILKNLVKIF